MTIWFDTHAHLQSDAFADDRPETIGRAFDSGVRWILLPGSDLADSQEALALAARYPGQLMCAVGVHPHHAAQVDDRTLQALRQLIDHDSNGYIVAIGEVGLDYHYEFSPRTVQRHVFEMHLELAWATGLPLVLHEREATADCLEILRRQAALGRLHASPGVFHCFSGSVETAGIVLEMGFYLGFDGPVTYKNARKSHEVIAICPPERLLVETDSPYLTPVPFRGKRNEPARVTLVGEKMAELMGIETSELAKITTENALRLFRKGS